MMGEDENFLERWSRRKREALTPLTAPDQARPPGQPLSQDQPTIDRDRQPASPSPGGGTPAEPVVPTFDLSSLPSLDSINAATDVRPFLAAGVPADLKRAALRRAWTTDPAIRDFVGLQENDWDFNNPGGIAGFGELPAGIDLQKMVSQLFGEREHANKPPTPAVPNAVEPTQISQEPRTTTEALPAADPAPDRAQQSHPAAEAIDDRKIVQSNKNIAMQNNIRRKHGSALPE